MFTDDEIIQSVRSGKTQNFELLIQRYGKKIINFINRMIGDADEAQSLAQDVFLRVYQGLHRYRLENSFQAFLYRVARNQTLNWIKKNRRLTFFSRLAGHELSKAEAADRHHPPEMLETQEQDRLLINALAGLHEEQRLGLIMKTYLELSYAQIADITGWSVPKIETLISRAKFNLKKNIRAQESQLGIVIKERKR